jgi:hypothetical protein
MHISRKPGHSRTRAQAVLCATVGALLLVALLAQASTASADFGIFSFDGSVTNADGSPDTLAGSHPFEASTTIALNHKIDSEGFEDPEGSVKDLKVDLPPGFIGDPSAVPKCTQAEFNRSAFETLCPNDSAVGTVIVHQTNATDVRPVYNMVPAPGVPAQFAFKVSLAPIYLDASVRPGDYGVSITIPSVPQAVGLLDTTLTLWGVPADHSHDEQRGSCLGFFGESLGVCPSDSTPRPFLTNPTLCAGPLPTKLSADSWADPGLVDTATFLSHDNGTPPSAVGPQECERLPFAPTLTAQPGTPQAGAPSGLTVDVRMPQFSNPTGLAEAALKKAVVTLPAGMSVSPSAAGGLDACSPDQIALTSADSPTCPDSSKIGAVKIETPLLERPLEGSVFLAQQSANPFGSLLAVYLVAEGSGVVIKLPGDVNADPVTGQLTATFDNDPQLPFTDLRVSFDGGARAPLSNPAQCGTYETKSQLSSWSGRTVESDSTFTIAEGVNGAQCPSGSFGPAFSAGTTNPQASAFSPFTLTFSRSDADETLGAIQVRLPAGLIGVLKSVAQCPEPLASQGACGAASEIGTTTVGAGAGSDPFYLGGKVFLTGPYKGAPFGLSVVVPAIAGPFNLGTVVVRAAINIDPHTAQVSVTSDPLPTILQGIPLQIKAVNVTIGRAGFMFNPTNCEAQSVGATISSSQGASAPVASRFQGANCAALPFKPTLTASTQGKASKADGASLTVAISAKGGPQPGGGEANIKKVEVQLPKQLPSRLTTLQKACSEAQFSTNPAACPHESNVGSAEASTPVLASPLKGPAYLVSHGGAAFPDLEIVLQGEGVTLVLDGKTQITKGITYSRFQAVPDAPISSFKLSLPTGKFSILTANLPESAKYNLCKQSLTMPTRITAQNGAKIEPKTPITISGCPKARKAAKKKTKKAAHARVTTKNGRKG